MRFATHALCVELKEIGFNLACFFYFFKPQGEQSIFTPAICKNWNELQDYMSRPTYEEVQKWLYENYGLWITIDDMSHTDIPTSGFKFTITEYGHFTDESSERRYGYSEINDLFNDAIYLCLKIIKQQNSN